MKNGPVALTGLGGIGKTQTTVEYAYRHRDNYAAILWLLADSRASLMKSCVALAAQLNLPQQHFQEEEEIIAAVKRWLQARGDWLLVLDNADDLTLVQDFLPPYLLGHVLLTARSSTTGILARGIAVEALPLIESMEFLLRRAKRLEKTIPLEDAPEDERKAAEALSQELGGCP